MTTMLTLGDFVFVRGEIPDSIGFGASQHMHVHTLVGGARVIDAMGAEPQRQAWSGWFSGPQALARARFLKRLTEAGRPLPLRYGEFAYTVVIADFCAEFRAGPYLPYSITLEVVSDLGAARHDPGAPGLAQVIVGDLAGAVANAAAIGDSQLISAVDAVVAVVSDSGGAGPAPAAAQAALPSIMGAQAQADRLNVAAAAQISAVGGLSAPSPNGHPVDPEALGRFGTSLATAADASRRSCQLIATAQVLARVAINLSAASGPSGAGGASLITGSTDLYHLAATAYGDARAWTRLAQANRRTDPVVSGITQLVIPAGAGAATGVLHA